MKHPNLVRHLYFVTPAMIGGAEQGFSGPMLRGTSFRGALRWWFRVLGGTLEEEQNLFGGISRKGPLASKVIVRLSDCVPGEGLTEMLIHENQHKCFPSGTTFTLTLFERSAGTLSERLWKDLKEALTAFCRLGTIGFKATRGYGMLSEEPPPSEAEILAWLPTLSAKGVYAFRVPEDSTRNAPEQHQTIKKASQVLEQLQNECRDLRHTHSGKKAFGDSSPRQASALHLCPVRTQEGTLPILVYTDAVLDLTKEESALSILWEKYTHCF